VAEAEAEAVAEADNVANVNNCLKFTIFSDFHYKKMMYIPSVEDMKEIISSAEACTSSFVLHAGDMCNDYKGSPELISAYLDNPEKMAVFGVYGNHELESCGNNMAFVTPRLTNREVVWGTPDGAIGSGDIAYYYFDEGKFRFIFLDTNYSYSEERCEWEHNHEASYTKPSENTLCDSLGPRQIAWLETVLERTASEQKHAILISHAALGGGARAHSPDHAKVCEIIDAVNVKVPRTVIMAINGHYHTNHISEENGVVYFDVNTVRNGFWNPKSIPHYTAETFEYTEYDKEGNAVSVKERLVSDLSMHSHTWFFDEPLFAHVTISPELEITVSGKEVGWVGGIDPNPELYADPEISSFSAKI
jgi:predicted phosphodiesterase